MHPAFGSQHHGPKDFIDTNIVDTFNLLQASLDYFNTLDKNNKKEFRFLHISTDEVYGSLKPNEPAFTEKNQYKPNSPYAASKAASDHLVRSWHKTYDLPVLTTNCSNNYGPYQFPEKLIPLVIMKALGNENIPIYGDGMQIRDWLYVEDHCEAIECVLKKGKVGETYNIGGNNEIANIDIVNEICQILDKKIPKKKELLTKSKLYLFKIGQAMTEDMRLILVKLFLILVGSQRKIFIPALARP